MLAAMSALPIYTLGPRERRVAAFADELRADVAAGLHEAVDHADRARLTRMRSLAAEIVSTVDGRSASEVEAIFAADEAPRTPLLGVVLIFNDHRRGVLLADDPALPRVGAPHAFAAPDVDHETALRQLAARWIPDEEIFPVPHGVCDSVTAGLAMPHTYFLTYVVDVTLLGEESIRGSLRAADDVLTTELDALTDYILNGAERTVLEAAFTLPAAVAKLLAEVAESAQSGAAEASGTQAQRYARLAETAAALRDVEEEATAFARADFVALDVRTPQVAAEIVVLDGDDRVLLTRPDDATPWSAVGSRCEVGETSAATAVRTAHETLRRDVDVAGLAGVVDSRLATEAGTNSPVTFVYVGRLCGPGGDADAVVQTAWAPVDQLQGWDLSPGQHDRITAALRSVEE